MSRAGLAGTLAALVAARLALPALAHPAYGFHRDEFLYFAMADHLDLFRMQFPPFIALAARASRALFGESVLAARVPAALAGTALFALVLGLARRLGGRGWALAFAAVALAAPAYLRASVLFQPVVFDQLWCAAAVTALLLAALGGSPRWWLAAGAALGLGALTKFSVAFYAAGLGAAALAPPLRRHLRTRWPWLGLAIALLLAVPSLSGQAAHGWPFIAQMRTLAGGQLGRVSPAGFLAGQLALLGPGLVVAAAGLAAAITGPGRDALLPAAVFALGVLAALAALHGKPYYGAPVYPPLIAIGAVTLERGLAAGRRRWMRPALAGLLGLLNLVALPLGVPVLAPEAMARYADRLGIAEAVRTNRGVTLALPQDYADMLGWEGLVDTVARAAGRLPPEQRARLVVLAGNYGEAGALEILGPARGLPRPASPAGDFHAWGPGPLPGEVVLAIGMSREELEPLFARIEQVAAYDNAWMVPEERNRRVYLCLEPRRSLREAWATLGPRWD